MSPEANPEVPNSFGQRLLRVAPVVSAIVALGTWAVSNFYEQSAKGFASRLAEARRDAVSLQTSILLNGRLADLRLLLATTHSSDCSDALKSMSPTATRR